MKKHNHAPTTAPKSVITVPKMTPYTAPAPTLSGVVDNMSGVPTAVSNAKHEHPVASGTSVLSQSINLFVADVTSSLVSARRDTIHTTVSTASSTTRRNNRRKALRSLAITRPIDACSVRTTTYLLRAKRGDFDLLTFG